MYRLPNGVSISAAQLERQLHAKLHLPRVLRTEDASEVRGAEDSIRHVEVCPIKQIEHVPAGLELATAANTPRARERDVGSAEAGRDDAVARRAAEGKRRGQRERRGIEPAVRRAL